MYPVSQAADITIVKGSLVPVGEDQLPMIEQTNEIVRSFNRLYKTDIFSEVKALVPKTGRLSGLDGQAKMSKSLKNAIYLGESEDDLKKHVMSMFTDPGHIRVEDPGKVEGNTVFEYLDAFATDTNKVQELKDHYQRGGLGDVKLKQYLFSVLNEKFTPIRERRAELISDKAELMNILLKGTDKAREIASQTMQEVRSALHLNY